MQLWITLPRGLSHCEIHYIIWALIYGQLAKLYCCHISMILPFEMRKRSMPVATYGLPVGGLPNNGPVFVPLFVHLINTLSPFVRISSCTSFRSGTLLLLQMHISLLLQGHYAILLVERDYVKQNQAIKSRQLLLAYHFEIYHHDNEELELHFLLLFFWCVQWLLFIHRFYR